jgi:hypothetical protein
MAIDHRTLTQRIAESVAFLAKCYATMQDHSRAHAINQCAITLEMAQARITHLERQLLEVPSVRDGYRQSVVQGLLAHPGGYILGDRSHRDRLMVDVERITDALMEGR